MVHDTFGENKRGPAARRAGMKEVAERAGVAISSVSRVISGHPDVSDAMQAKVLTAIDELGYRPDVLAQSLRTGESRMIGFVAADIGNPLFAQISVGAEVALRARGYSMMVANAGGDDALALEQFEAMAQRRIDGLLISVGDEGDDALRRALETAPFPIALIDREIDAAHVAAVLSDHDSGITAAAAHLIGLGHRRIALVGGSPRVRPSRERAASLERAAASHDGVDAVIRMGEFTADHGYAATTALMAESDAPTAIIAGGNQILVGVLRALRDLALSVPGDVSLVTCDDVALSEFLSPPLSTISRDPAEIGRVAAEALLAQLRTGDDGDRILLPTGFRITESCGPPRAQD